MAEAYAIVRRLAGEGDPEAMFALADMFWRGAGVEQNVALGREIFRRAAAAGHPMALLASWDELVHGAEVWLVVTFFPGLVWALVHRYRLGDESLGRLLVAALAYPAFLLLGLVATFRAIARQATGRQAWAKTERLAEEPLSSPLQHALAA